MDVHNCKEGWMVIFDRRTSIKWGDKIFMKKKKTVNGKTVTVAGV